MTCKGVLGIQWCKVVIIGARLLIIASQWNYFLRPNVCKIATYSKVVNGPYDLRRHLRHTMLK